MNSTALSPWTESLIYQFESVARDRLETPPLRQRIEGKLEELLASAGKCLVGREWGRETQTILPPEGRLVRHSACAGRGCRVDGCGGFGWIRVKERV